MCCKVYLTLSLPRLMEGCWVWVATREQGISYKSQPCLPGATSGSRQRGWRNSNLLFTLHFKHPQFFSRRARAILIADANFPWKNCILGPVSTSLFLVYKCLPCNISKNGNMSQFLSEFIPIVYILQSSASMVLCFYDSPPHLYLN